MPRPIRVQILITPSAVWWALAGALFFLAPLELGTETLTLVTYYPAPSGIYNRMVTTSDTYLARDGGNVGIGTGTTPPRVRLDVQGTLGITPPAACTPQNYSFSGVAAFTPCPANTYATYVAGVYTTDQVGSNVPSGAATYGTMLCCAYPP